MTMDPRAIFVAATGQNVGKTTICLGIFAGLQKRFPRVGFIKPVGQLTVNVADGSAVDKDAVLFKEHFGLRSRYEDLSPVLLPPGLTKTYLDGRVDTDDMRRQIQVAYSNVRGSHDFTVVEGTGHVGVGSIVGLNNAKIAAELDLEMVIIASGGLGSATDELALNMGLADKYGVKVRGVILNRVLDEKRDMILDYFPKALAQFDVPLIGCVPYCSYLSIPTMQDFEMLFDTKLLSGKQYRYRHFRETRLVAGSIESYFAEITPNELIITPASRDDVIEAILEHHSKHVDLKVGLLLTSAQPPKERTLKLIQESDIPVLYVPRCSYDAMKEITSFTAKIRREDVRKVHKAIHLVEKHINFEALCQRDVAVPV